MVHIFCMIINIFYIPLYGILSGNDWKLKLRECFPEFQRHLMFHNLKEFEVQLGVTQKSHRRWAAQVLGNDAMNGIVY